MILLNWLNAFRHRIRQRRRKQQLPGSRSGIASTPGRSKRPLRFTPQQIELLEERVLLATTTLIVANGDWTDGNDWSGDAPIAGDTAQIGNSAGVATGTATLSNGATNSVAIVSLGNATGTDGTLVVSGANTVLNASTLSVGTIGVGTLTVATGGVLSANNFIQAGQTNGTGGGGTFNIDATSQINTTDDLDLQGSGTYTLPIASPPTNGKLSAKGLEIARTNNNNVTLNATSAGGAVDSTFSRPLLVGTGPDATGVLNLNDVTFDGFSTVVQLPLEAVQQQVQ